MQDDHYDSHSSTMLVCWYAGKSDGDVCSIHVCREGVVMINAHAFSFKVLHAKLTEIHIVPDLLSS